MGVHAGHVHEKRASHTAPQPAGQKKQPKHVQRKGRWDEVKLYALGYKQELPRTMTFFNNAGCAFSVLSFFAIMDSYTTQGLAYGGPVVAVWGWVVVSFFSLIVAACMAELLSAFPTSGGLYYWSYILGPPRARTLLCWLTGWLNLLGQAAFTCSLEYSLTQLVSTLVTLHTTGDNGKGGYVMGQWEILAVFTALLIATSILNIINQTASATLITLSTLWHMVASVGFMGALWATARTVNPPSYVLQAWEPHTELHGISSPPYIVLVGLLMSQWTIMGYDACVNMCEETVDAEYAAAWAVVAGVAACAVWGLAFVLVLTIVLPLSAGIVEGKGSVVPGHAVAQITWDVFMARYGNGRGAIPLLYIPAIGLFLCCVTSHMSSGRMVYAFSRDGAMLGARFLRRLGERSKQPVAGMWFMATLSWLIGLPAIFNEQAFGAISAVSVVALSLSYGIPIGLRWWQGADAFIPGPVRLGRWSMPLSATACLWIGLVSVVFCLPTKYPVNSENMNYGPAFLIGIVAIALVTWWAPKVGGVHWFTGPMPNIGLFNDADTRAGSQTAKPVPPVLLPSSLHSELGRVEETDGSDAGSSTSQLPLLASVSGAAMGTSIHAMSVRHSCSSRSGSHRDAARHSTVGVAIKSRLLGLPSTRRSMTCALPDASNDAGSPLLAASSCHSRGPASGGSAGMSQDLLTLSQASYWQVPTYLSGQTSLSGLAGSSMGAAGRTAAGAPPPARCNSHQQAEGSEKLAVVSQQLSRLPQHMHASLHGVAHHAHGPLSHGPGSPTVTLMSSLHGVSQQGSSPPSSSQLLNRQQQEAAAKASTALIRLHTLNSLRHGASMQASRGSQWPQQATSPPSQSQLPDELQLVARSGSDQALGGRRLSAIARARSAHSLLTHRQQSAQMSVPTAPDALARQGSTHSKDAPSTRPSLRCPASWKFDDDQQRDVRMGGDESAEGLDGVGCLGRSLSWRSGGGRQQARRPRPPVKRSRTLGSLTRVTALDLQRQLLLDTTIGPGCPAPLLLQRPAAAVYVQPRGYNATEAAEKAAAGHGEDGSRLLSHQHDSLSQAAAVPVARSSRGGLVQRRPTRRASVSFQLDSQAPDEHEHSWGLAPIARPPVVAAQGCEEAGVEEEAAAATISVTVHAGLLPLPPSPPPPHIITNPLFAHSSDAGGTGGVGRPERTPQGQCSGGPGSGDSRFSGGLFGLFGRKSRRAHTEEDVGVEAAAAEAVAAAEKWAPLGAVVPTQAQHITVSASYATVAPTLAPRGTSLVTGSTGGTVGTGGTDGTSRRRQQVVLVDPSMADAIDIVLAGGGRGGLEGAGGGSSAAVTSGERGSATGERERGSRGSSGPRRSGRTFHSHEEAGGAVAAPTQLPLSSRSVPAARAGAVARPAVAPPEGSAAGKERTSRSDRGSGGSSKFGSHAVQNHLKGVTSHAHGVTSVTATDLGVRPGTEHRGSDRKGSTGSRGVMSLEACTVVGGAAQVTARERASAAGTHGARWGQVRRLVDASDWEQQQSETSSQTANASSSSTPLATALSRAMASAGASRAGGGVGSAAGAGGAGFSQAEHARVSAAAAAAHRRASQVMRAAAAGRAVAAPPATATATATAAPSRALPRGRPPVAPTVQQYSGTLPAVQQYAHMGDGCRQRVTSGAGASEGSSGRGGALALSSVHTVASSVRSEVTGSIPGDDGGSCLQYV